MREYTSPLIDDMDVSVEGVYAGSGSSPDIPDIPIIPPKDDPTPPGGDYTVEEKGWTSHNSGSHSEGQLYVHYTGEGGKVSRVSVEYTTNFDIIEIWGYGPSEVTQTSSRSFSVSRSNTCPFNSGENLELKFGLKSNVEDYKSQNNSLGAVGVSSSPNSGIYKCTMVGQPRFS